MPKTEPTILSPTGIDLDRLDPDAVKATQRLVSRGYEAYLVGGCVRDLLLRLKPKDFDMATSARPQQVKRTFPRNCRIIGRRFKLAHLHFQRNTKILELATFRRTPEDDGDDDLLITRDNEFGTAEQDARRRDFTVNAMFLDPTSDTIVDHVHGLEDIRAKVIRTIGDPRVRLREDPIRILRAAKFAGRLGFSIEPETYAAMAETAGDLVRAAPPRVLEEILRLLRGGHALDSFQLLRDVGAIKYLVPAVAQFLSEADHDHRENFWRLLEALDRRVLEGQVPQSAVLLGALLVWPVLARAEREPNRSPSSIAEELLGSLSQDLKLPRRDAGCLKRICCVQHRFEPSDTARRFRKGGFIRGPYFAEALELFGLRVDADEADPEQLAIWTKLASGHSEEDAEAEGDEHVGPEDGEETRPRKRRRRRRGGRRSTEDYAPAEAEDEPQAAEAGPEEPAAEEAKEADSEPTPAKKKTRKRRSKKAKSAPRSADPDAFGFGAVSDDELEQPEPLEEPEDEEPEDEPSTDEPESPTTERTPVTAGPDEESSDRPEDAAEETEDESARPRRKRRRRRKKKSASTESRDEATEAEGDEPRARKAVKQTRKTQERKTQERRPQERKGQERRGQERKGKKSQRKRRGQDRPRDVDVVPRFRDRRGKVEVLEPEGVDLSAFDVELDPKRVPTFGTIVEGKGRPKRRTPRVRDDGLDDYKPPPPPGSDAPPPPPRDDAKDPDTFGDW